MKLRCACMAAVALSLTGAAAWANTSTPALAYSGDAQSLGNPDFTLGWEFQVLSATTVDGLGVLDSTDAGLADSHEVGLWDANGNLEAFGVVAAGTADALIANFRYAAIAPVALAPGEYYIGALYTDGDDAVGFPGSGSISTVPGIAYLQATYVGGSSLDDPTNGNGGPGYFGPNFTTEVPEPAAWSLMMVGFGAMGVVARRRRGVVAI